VKLSVRARKRLAQVVVSAVASAIAGIGEPAARLTTLEAAVEGALRAVGAEALTTVLAEVGTGSVGPTRPWRCGAPQRTDHYVTCPPQTVLGTVPVRRAAYRWASCGHRECPLDAHLDLREGRTSALLSVRLGLCAALEPFVPASALLAELTGVRVSPKRTQLVSEALGAPVAAAQEATPLPLRPSPMGAPPAPARLYLGVDGVLDCTTERTADHELVWRAAKVGVWYEPQAPGPPGTGRASRLAPAGLPIDVADPQRRTDVVTMGDWAALADLVWQAGQRHGLEQAVEIIVLGDGAVWITSLIEAILTGLSARIIQVLDIRHAEGHLWTVAPACLGERALGWIQTPLTDLREGRVAALVAAVRARPVSSPDTAKLVVTTAPYDEERAEQMAYPTFRAQGIPIGSGLVESACKRLVAQRAKGPGMHWTVAGAQAIATLRAAYLSGRWDEVRALARAV
jgi:hypothetical protein